MMFEFIVIILLGYLLGAIPFALIVGKLTRGIDVREYGSGNIGFTNVLRTVGIKAGIITFIGDVGKGAIAVSIARFYIGGDVLSLGSLDLDFQAAQALAGLAAVIGHNWSVYIKLQGGKGVDTSLGALSTMAPWTGLTCVIIAVIVISHWRYVSLGSMSGAAGSIVILAPLVALERQPVEYLVFGILVTILIIFRHQDNIANLRAGTERKLGQKGERR